MALHADDVLRELTEDRRLITGTRPDLKDVVSGPASSSSVMRATT
jgi:hypothetical protein